MRNTIILLLIGMMVVCLVSGCTNKQVPATDSDLGNNQINSNNPAQDNPAASEVDATILSETDNVDIGEMI
jgi:hypothetical protein